MRMITLILLFSVFCGYATPYDLRSPNGKLRLNFTLADSGAPVYSLTFNDAEVIESSPMGFSLRDRTDLRKEFLISKIDTAEVDETWQPVWGEVSQIRNHYRELLVTMEKHTPQKIRMLIRFRLFNDGLGFRYEFPKQANLSYFIISAEHTTFDLTDDHKTFWIPGDYDSNEYSYYTTALSEINGLKGQSVVEISTRSVWSPDGVQTPLLLKTDENIYIHIHEAALIDFPAMQLLVNRKRFSLQSNLVPDPAGNMAYLQTPARTPWRTIIVSDKAEEILASKLILNLNEPSKINETDWIRPQKYIGIWWGMHIGRQTWNYADSGNIKLNEVDWNGLNPNGRHGATTENTKRYIDFAAEHGIDAVLVEGWNVGWEDWFGNWKEEVFDFVTPYPDFDVEALQVYAAQKSVRLIMHHETSGAVTNYERRMQDAFMFMRKYGYQAVKTGYVGRIIPRGEYHDGQWMVNHYVRVTEFAARHQIMLNAHEPVRPTGLHRTYPNWLACEAARGNEFNAWSKGNPPEHETILPFTRLLGGPMDYTPGIFQIKLDYYEPGKTEQVHTTLIKQLALYITMYSPLQMAADLPENYERFPDAFRFIEDVAVDWEDSRVIAAEPGDYIVIARKAKNTENWFLGAITDENPRRMKVKLDFLDPEILYNANLYLDAADAHWQKNPMAYAIEKRRVDHTVILELVLAPGGGAAISISPASETGR